jgi:hypothetical protein
MTMWTRGILIVSTWLVAVVPLVAQPRVTDSATVSYLHQRRNVDGGYAPTQPPSDKPLGSSLRATTSAIRAFKYLGGQPDRLADTARFVDRCYDKATGGFGDVPDQPPTVFSTAVGVMTAVELKLPPESYRDGAVKFLSDRSNSMEEIRVAAAAFEALQLRPPTADRWLRQIATTRSPDGTCGADSGGARATGGTAALILRLGGAIEHRDAVLRAMRAGQRPDGGFGTAERPDSDLESTYRVMRAFAMMKELPRDPPKLRAFIAKCHAETGGYGERVGEPPTVAGTYFAAIILHWLDQR